MLKKFLIASLLISNLLLNFSAFASEKPANSGIKTAINVDKMTPEFTIKLPANRSTGYSWYLVPSDNAFIQATEQQYVGGSKPGEGGYEVWSFRVASEAFTVPYQIPLNFVYARPWEKPVKKLSFSIYTHDG